jgi:outer membrane receptor protein involved in Fe transport
LHFSCPLATRVARHLALAATLSAPLVTHSAAAADAARAVDAEVLEEVTVVGITPLDVLGPAAGAAQRADAAAIEASNALDLTAFVNRRLGSAYLNEVQGNPVQADLNFRGFTASPLLGTPQGLSVYLDGVRLNQPFGDVVSWDLIPRSAIRELTLLPGANPLFGLNTLGGSVVLASKDGWSAPGTQLAAAYGSWDRRVVEAQSGGSDGPWAWYATANRFEEDGWRDFSPSQANQAFAKGSWRDADTQVNATLSAAETDLNGNGLQELQLLLQDRGSVYTQPDNTRNRAVLASVNARHDLAPSTTIAANAWYRNVRSTSFNGDINEGSLEENVYQPSAAERAALTAAGYSGFPLAGENAANTPFPRWRCIANALLNAEPGEKCNGLLNRGYSSQQEMGSQAQIDFDLPLAGRDNDITLGAAVVHGRMHFLQSAQYGYLDAERGVVDVTGPGAFADGTQDSENASDSRVDLDGDSRTWSVFLSDSLALTPALRVTVAGRYDSTTVRNRDALQPGGGTGSLDGDHHFARFNPAAGLNYQAGATTLHASVGQSSRTPSAIELGCADPESPCRLPNSMAGDPPLDPVVATNIEAGARGRAAAGLHWSVNVFRSDNRDDILFVADEQAGFGFFRNFGRTRRQGIELGLDGVAGPVQWGANYSRLDATFRSAETVNGEANSGNDGAAPGFEGSIDIAPGDRLPLVPRHIAKLFIDWRLLPTVSVNADWRYLGASLARGNENGEHEPDGLYYLGEGGSGGYGVLDLGVLWQPRSMLDLYVQVSNALDKDYATASQLGATGFTATGQYVARPFAAPVIDGERPLRHSTFFAPGAPRSVLAGVRYRFGE